MSDHARPYRAVLATAILAIAFSTGACGGSPDRQQGPSSGSPSGAPSIASPIGSESTPIDGVYSVTITEEDAVAAGIPKGKFVEFVGEYELSMVRGQIQIWFTHVVTLEVLRGTYTVDGNALAVSGEDAPNLTFDWKLDHGKLELELTETDHPDDRALDELIFATHPWERKL